MSPSEHHDSGTEKADEIDTTLMNLGTQARTVPSKRRVDNVERKSKLWSKAAVVASAVIALFSLGLSGYNTQDIADNAVKAAVTDQSIKSLEDANAKLSARGLPQIPVPQPGEQIDINGLVSSVSALVLADITRDPRFRGPEGSTGAPGGEGQTGDTGDEGQDGSEGARGSDGLTPVPGLTSDGHLIFSTPGGTTDLGSVVGPMGPGGPKGDKGDRGSVGPVCPEGFTPQKFWVDTYDDEEILSTPARRLVVLCV